MTREIAIGLLVCGMFIFTGCGRGNVSGDIFLPTVGGQAKRGTDVEVLLVHVTSQLEKHLTALEGEYAQAMGPVKKSYEDAKASADAWLAEAQRLPILSPSYESSMASWRQASGSAISEAAKVDALQAQYRARTVALLKEYQARSTRTGANGGYTFTDIPTGRTLIFAEWSTREPIGTSWYDIKHVWMAPLEIQRGANRLDLSGSNEGNVFWRK